MAAADTSTSSQRNASNGHTNGHANGHGDPYVQFGTSVVGFDMPNFNEVQIESFNWFLEKGVLRALEKATPVKDFTGEKFELRYNGFRFEEPKFNEEECLEREENYSRRLLATIELLVNHEGEEESREQELYLCDFPMMTKNGSFIIKGSEKAVISQLIRSPGAYYHVVPDSATGGVLGMGKVIPDNGAWMELETSNRDGLSVKADRKRKLSTVVMLRAISTVWDGTNADRYLGIDHSERFRNDLQHEIYDRLTKDGYRAAPEVNLNPADQRIPDDDMRADLAVFGNNGAELMVMLDQDPSSNPNAEKEDRQLYRKLTSAGWSVHRICGADWYKDDAARRKVYNALKRKCTAHGIVPWREPWGINQWRTLDDFKSLFPEPETGDEESQRRFMEESWSRESGLDEADYEGELALKALHRVMKPGEPPTAKGAQDLIRNMFFEPKSYDIGEVGRHKLNQGLNLDIPQHVRTLTKRDFIGIIGRQIAVNRGEALPDDIDNLKNRRSRLVGELALNALGVGLKRMERVIRDRMTTHPHNTTPAALINPRAVDAAVREFFSSGQMSQLMDQTNPLSELTHKRRITALGPGGLTRDRAGFDVRDVHHSHYGRICPIETPEGPNIGLLGSFATHAKVNEHGFVETPYRIVRKTISNKVDPDEIVGRVLTGDVIERHGKEIRGKKGDVITAEIAAKLHQLGPQEIPVEPYITNSPEDVVYLDAHEEAGKIIAQTGRSGIEIDDKLGKLPDRVPCRTGDERYSTVPADAVDYIDVSPAQIVSVSTGLIPFLEHDDATRALMGSNMQRQAVPLVLPQSPVVGTGIEHRAAVDSGQVAVLTELDEGIVTSATADQIVVESLTDDRQQVVNLKKFRRTNQSTCLDQHPIVKKGQIVSKDDPLADSMSTDDGKLALGQNLLVGFMSWGGGNFEDAIILNEDLVKHDRFTSVHIEKQVAQAREGKLGPEEITRDIPNVGEAKLEYLNEEGIVVEGTWISQGDILVGKITPKGETELTAEEKLLRAIFGEKARDVKDSSLRARHGEKGKVIQVTEIDREIDTDRQMLPGVTKEVRVWFAHSRKITEGDKMAGRHGNKGVVAMILPREDMPHMEDGTPLDIVLNPIGVPSRMNLGQLLETHLGLAAHSMGCKTVTPVFDSATDKQIEDWLARSWFVEQSGAIDHKSLDRSNIDVDVLTEWLTENGLAHLLKLDGDKLPGWVAAPHTIWDERVETEGSASEACLRMWLPDHLTTDEADELASKGRTQIMDVARRVDREQGKAAPVLGKKQLIDGRTGEKFEKPVTVGIMYMMKLSHLAEDKIHARSTGPYSMITQQPLGGKAQFGGQRLGEMEVWALEAYSAPHTLQEMLTIKSDDIDGRAVAYDAIVNGFPVEAHNLPASFNVLTKELQSLGLYFNVVRSNDPDFVEDRPAEPEGAGDFRAVTDSESGDFHDVVITSDLGSNVAMLEQPPEPEEMDKLFGIATDGDEDDDPEFQDADLDDFAVSTNGHPSGDDSAT